MRSHLEQRLVRLEAIAGCTCGVRSAQQWRVERGQLVLNRTCPVHPGRDLKQLVAIPLLPGDERL